MNNLGQLFDKEGEGWATAENLRKIKNGELTVEEAKKEFERINTENNDNADNKWLTDQLEKYNVPVLENETQVEQFLNGEQVEGFPEFDGSTTSGRQRNTIEEERKKRQRKYGEKIQGGVLRYPAEALTEHTDYLQIDIEKYEAIGSNYITSTASSGR